MRATDLRTVYLNQVKRKLRCPRSTKKRLLVGLKAELADAFEEMPADLSTITGQFGAPNEMALELESVLSDDIVEQYIKRQKRLCWVCLIVGIIAVALLICYIIWIATYDVSYTVKQVITGG